MIEVDGVSKHFGGKQGVQDVTFRVERGEILGLLGPNGAGKTTMLRMLTGSLAPTSGTICVSGVNVWTHRELARGRIGYLPDRAPLYRDVTVRGFVTFAAALRGVPTTKCRRRVDEVLDFFDLGSVAGSTVGSLSRGCRQRVGLAQAIVHDPEVLVLDEPVGGLDPRQMSEMRELIRCLGQKRTVILSSHILAEVQVLCHRVLVMDRGRVIAEDAPDRLGHQFQSTRRYKVQVLGNLFRARDIALGLPGVTSAEIWGSVLHVDTETDVDIRQELFYRLAEAQLPLTELTPVEMSLEDVFLRLTTQHQGVGGMEENPVSH